MKATPLGFGMCMVCMMHVDEACNAEYAEGAAPSRKHTYRVADGDQECVDRRALLLQAAAQLPGRWAQVDLVLQSQPASVHDDRELSACDQAGVGGTPWTGVQQRQVAGGASRWQWALTRW